jgi:hypothetical protein
MNNTITMDIPKGYVIDVENSDLANGIIKTKKAKISTRWVDLESFTGWYVTDISRLSEAGGCTTTSSNQNIYATEAQAKASLAQAQLSQIMKDVNGDWEADWIKHSQTKYGITLCDCFWYADKAGATRTFLAFPTKELAQQVLDENMDLLEQYKPLA